VGQLNYPSVFSKNITGLIKDATYYYRAYASNAAGAEAWAVASSSFVATVSLPEVENTGVDNEFGPFVTLKGKIISTGGANTRAFICWGPVEGNTISTASWANVINVGLQTGNFSTVINTQTGSNYFYTCYVTNMVGSAWAIPPLPFGYYNIRYVNKDATGLGNGYNWSNGFTTIQTAINACRKGFTNIIYIKGQTFMMPAQLVITNSYLWIKGGYEGISGYPGNRNSTTWPTILTNQGGTIRFLNISGATNVLIDEITITGANAPGYGGAGYIYNSTGVRFKNCRIVGNTALEKGGGLYFNNVAAPFIEGSTIRVNTLNRNSNSTQGGGIYGVNCTGGVITNSVIEHNVVNAWGGYDYCYGGGLFLSGGSWVIRDSAIRYNRLVSTYYGRTYGGGIFVESGTHVVTNCIIAQNHSEGTQYQEGGGVYVSSGSVVMHFVSLVGNYPEGVRRGGGNAEVRNSIIWKNWDDIVGSVVLSYCDIEDGDNGIGCFSEDPLFDRGIYLGAGSPCIDAGNMSAVAAGLGNKTTRSGGEVDSGVVDIGYHWGGGLSDVDKDIYVSVSGNDNNDGTSWGNAYRSVKKALGRAVEGSYIHIGAGTYDISSGERFPLIINRYGVSLYGTNAQTTIIDANGSDQRVFHITDNSFAIIRGLTIAGGGKRTWAPIEEGAGIYSSYAYNQVITSCIISNNVGGRPGGGVCIYRSLEQIISNCVFSANVLEVLDRDQIRAGGGFCGSYSEGILIDSIFSNNIARNSFHGWSYTLPAGAGFALEGGRWIIEQCVVRDGYVVGQGGWSDYSPLRGGGVYIVSGMHLLKNVLIVTNKVQADRGELGDGIYVAGGNLILENCTIANNRGEGLRNENGVVSATNCIFWGNGDDIIGPIVLSYCDIEDGDNNGTNGCFSVDPLFVDFIYYHEQSTCGNYAGGYFKGGCWIHSLQTSPCIDAGAPWGNYSREPYPHGSCINVGAYGNTVVASKTPISATIFILR